MNIGSIQPRDIIALVVVIGGITLIGLGRDSIVGSILLAVISFYFGHAVATKKGGDQ